MSWYLIIMHGKSSWSWRCWACFLHFLRSKAREIKNRYMKLEFFIRRFIIRSFMSETETLGGYMNYK